MSKIELLLSEVEVNNDELPTANDEIILGLLGMDIDAICDGVNAVDRLKEVLREGRCLIITDGMAWQANLEAVMVQEELDLDEACNCCCTNS